MRVTNNNVKNILTNETATPSTTSETKKIYGNKCKELSKLGELLLIDPIQGVQIPSLKGLSHESFKAFLEMKDPGIFKIWETLSSSYSQHKNPTHFLYDSTTILRIETIQKRIQEACQNITEGELSFFDEDLSHWVNDISNNSSYLMVRSSGVEDGKDFVNAGGNISECYVEPTTAALFTACGKVIASYFAFPSLKNQIVAGVNPFSSEPILSVLVQELVGEAVGGSLDEHQIPTSLVLFTHEPNESEDDFHVLKVSATFGHGTGVVSSAGVGSDTIHVVRSRIQADQPLEAYQNRLKEARLAPLRNPSTGLVELQLIQNPPSMQQKRSLTTDLVSRLDSLAKFIEKHFDNQPMDVEIVIKNDTIYIVQARPIVRPKAVPTYVSDQLLHSNGSPFSQKIEVGVLALGKGEVLQIRNKNEILLCNNLAEAEEKYLPAIHKLVIVGKEEPSNSHPVVNFSSLGVLCLHADCLTKAVSLLQSISLNTPLVACPQSGRLWIWNENKANSRSCIKEGYYSHPGQIGVSFENQSISSPYAPPPINNLPKEINQAIRSLQEATTTTVAQKALLNLQILTFERPHTYSLDFPLLQDASKVTAVFRAKVESTVEEIEKSFKEDAPRLEKLFHIKTLSTLLSSQPKDALSAFSLLDINQIKNTTNSMLLYQNQFNRSNWMEFLPAKDYALTPEGEKLWETFLLELEFFANSSQKTKFKELMEQISKYHALPTFINFIALPLLLNPTPIEKAGWLEFLKINPSLDRSSQSTWNLEKLTSSISTTDKNLLKTLGEKKKELSRLQNNLALFSDPKTFNRAKNDLFDLLTFFSNRKEFISPMKSGTELTKILVAEFLKEIVEVTDTAIKNMKASPDFTVEEKISNLSSLLTKNLELLELWMESQDLDPNLFGDFTGAPGSAYISRIKRALKNCSSIKNATMLLPSSGFSVQAAMIGSQANYTRHLPKTLEDIFTLIHQNQIFIISHMNQDSLPSNLKTSPLTPPLLQKAFQELEKIETFNNRPKLHGVSLLNSGASFHYNIPLQNHSAGFTIEYKKDGSLTFHGKLFGEARSRWPEIANCVNVLNNIEELLLLHPLNQTEQEVVFSWALHNFDEIGVAKELFEQFLRASFWGLSTNDTISFLGKNGKFSLDKGASYYREAFENQYIFV